MKTSRHKGAGPLTCILLLVFAPTALGYSVGAPDIACSTFRPGHSGTPQTSTPPFVFTPSVAEVEPGKRISLSLESTSPLNYKGFLVGARNATTKELVGTFFTTQHKYLTCGSGINNAVTHQNSNDKFKENVEWEAPSDYVGDVIFTGAYVAEYEQYWVNVTSEKLTVRGRRSTPPTNAATLETPVSTDLSSPEAESVDDPTTLFINAISHTSERPVSLSEITPSENPTTTPTSRTTDSTSSTSTSTFTTTTTSASTERPSVVRSKVNILDKIRKGLKTTEATTARSETASEPTAESGKLSGVYEGCLETKGCLGIPFGCVDQKNCKSLMTYTRDPAKLHVFELMGKVTGNGYVAGGLSQDSIMSDDSVMLCRRIDDKVDVLMTWNEGKNNRLLGKDVEHGLVPMTTSEIDGMVYCKFSRDPFTKFKGIQFDLMNDKLHLMIANGPVGADGAPNYHTGGRAVTTSALSLSEYRHEELNSNLYIGLHGSFMIGAWVGAASCGILFARYYKKTWQGSKCCGLDVWFHLHRFFMILTWCLVCTAIALIFIFKREWTGTTHGWIGIFSAGLCFIQPFMALIRCHPGDERRPIFNWFHWFVGNSAQILGIVAIFFGLEYANGQFSSPSWNWYILILFIIFHVLMHLILTFADCICNSRKQDQVDVYPMVDYGGSKNSLQHTERSLDAKGSGFRKFILGVYLPVNWLFVAALVVVLLHSEDTMRSWFASVM